ncbi:MAG TPA: peptidylprolyl isomerase [Prosthecobacter sp.]|nr:peptidylprolyl isomerase [Prosthecobacter sp.]HRK14926.1 peptidylprolyl isomerase [Prosthecobacter sp.]
MKTSPIFFALLAAPALMAQTSAPDQPLAPIPPLTPLPPIERLADQAQRELFDAAAGSVPKNDGPVVSQSGRKTTFSALPGEDPSAWKSDELRKLAVMEVSFGGAVETVMFVLHPQDAPQTVSNFLDNCETGAYNGLAFHRAIEGFIVQTGDPLTSDEGARERWGTGGEEKTVPAEIKRKHRKGAVAMGRRSDSVNPGRRSNGFQFYFALGNFGSLDGKYTVFGQVVSGLETLERISKMPVDSNDCPVARIEIKSLKVLDQKGPLQEPVRDTGDGRKYTKPAAAKGFFERFLERVW